MSISRYGRTMRALIVATVIHYRRVAIREVGKALGLTETCHRRAGRHGLGYLGGDRSRATMSIS